MKKSGKIFICILMLTACAAVMVNCNGTHSDSTPSLQPPAAKLAGTWNVTTTTGNNTCGEAAGTTTQSVVTVTHAEGSNTFTATVQSDGSSFSGTISGNAINFSRNYPENGGTTTDSYSATLDTTQNRMTMTGTSSWTWSNGTSNCSGTDTVTCVLASGGGGGGVTTGTTNTTTTTTGGGVTTGTTNTTTTTTGSGPSPTDTIAYAKAMAVGGWYYAGSSCTNPPYPRTELNTFLCPGGGLRGVERLKTDSNHTYDYLARGTYSITKITQVNTPSPSASIDLSYTTTINIGGVTDSGPGILGGANTPMFYLQSDDSIRYWYNTCWAVMLRMKDGSNKDVDNSYCTGSTGGSSQCGTDADCGRCWYCEKSGSSSICRYGGEGPSGCYRGWQP